MVGRTISQYKILEEIGGGGMGVVYKAEDTKPHRSVALKFLPSELTSDETAKTRFIHEAQAASALDHQNIAVAHESRANHLQSKKSDFSPECAMIKVRLLP